MRSTLHTIGLTFITTGYIVAPNSKQPFLNMKTLVLLMQVPAERAEGPGKHQAKAYTYIPV